VIFPWLIFLIKRWEKRDSKLSSCFLNENPTIIKSFDGMKADGSGGTGSKNKMFEKEIKDDVFDRQKRPARLLPPRIFL